MTDLQPQLGTPKQFCSVCGCERLPLTRKLMSFGACSNLACPEPLKDYEAEKLAAPQARPAPPQENPSRWAFESREYEGEGVAGEAQGEAIHPRKLGEAGKHLRSISTPVPPTGEDDPDDDPVDAGAHPAPEQCPAFKLEHVQAQLGNANALIGLIQGTVSEFFGDGERWSDFDVLHIGVAKIAEVARAAHPEENQSRSIHDRAHVDARSSQDGTSGDRVPVQGEGWICPEQISAHPESRGAALKELPDTSFTFDERMILWQILRKAKGASFEMNWANQQVIAVEEKIMPSTVSTVMASPPSSPGAPQTRFNDFYDDSHPFQVWWQRFGQFIMAGGGRTESIWAARGWIAREQMACGVEVTGDSMHERASSPGAETEKK